jgi:hypothetical protein
VVSTIERTGKGTEDQTSAPPRLPAPQNARFPSSTNKKLTTSPFHDPFAFHFKEPTSQVPIHRQDLSSSVDQHRTIPSSIHDSFAFNHNDSNSFSTSNQTISLPHPFHDTFAPSYDSNSLSHNVVTPKLEQQLRTELPSSPFFNPFFFGSNSNFPIHNVPVSASHEQLPSLTDPLSSIFNSSTTTSSTCLQPSPDTPSLSPCRRPAPGRAITHNTLRPHVSAANRLFSWRTPHGINEDSRILERLPTQLAEAAKLSIMGAFASSSRSTYGAGILRFNQFCDHYSIPESDRMPASHALLCAFIAEHKGAVSGSTIRSWLSGIRAFHLVNQAEWPGDNAWVKMARTSANKEGSHHKRPLRAPVSIEHLLALSRSISLSNPFHAAVWAVALTTFFGCRRLGETTVATMLSFDERLHVLRSVEYAILIPLPND